MLILGSISVVACRRHGDDAIQIARFASATEAQDFVDVHRAEEIPVYDSNGNHVDRFRIKDGHWDFFYQFHMPVVHSSLN